MNKYTFHKGYQLNDKLRKAFNHLAETTFHISFEIWYESGFWNDKYIPYTLFDKNKAIANVSINIMDFNFLGEHKRFIQIGTVMTDEDYRGRGLSRFLMEKVLNEWNDKCEFIYLYANSSVLTFYPKLGFTPVKEYERFKKVKKSIPPEVLKLNMNEQANRNRLYDYAKHTYIFGKLAMQENADLVLFYCITSLKENVFYIPSFDAIVIAKRNNNHLLIHDVFSKSKINLEEVVNSLCDAQTESVLLGFIPRDCTLYEEREVDEVKKDEVLFIQKGKTKLFEENKLMFPVLSHA